jgi:hypothetical protein
MMTANEEKVALSVWVEKHIKLALQELADADRRNVSNYLTGVLSEHIDGQRRKGKGAFKR